jgi:hypothetical protein
MELSEETLMDILNLYSTVRIDSEKIRKAFVTVVYPPESAGFGIPKVIVSPEELSEEEIDQNVERHGQAERALADGAGGNEAVRP